MAAVMIIVGNEEMRTRDGNAMNFFFFEGGSLDLNTRKEGRKRVESGRMKERKSGEKDEEVRRGEVRREERER